MDITPADLLVAVQRSVSAASAFFAVDREHGAEVTYLTDDRIATTEVPMTLDEWFDAPCLRAGNRATVLRLADIWPIEARDRVPYLRARGRASAVADGLLVPLHEAESAKAAIAVERREGQPAFTDADVATLEALAPVLSAALRARRSVAELDYQRAALRALGNVSGTVLIVDRDHKRVIWAEAGATSTSWPEHENAIVNGVDRLLAARANDDPLPTPPRLCCGTIVSAVAIEGSPIFGHARCAVAEMINGMKAPASSAHGSCLVLLSRREREIARMLMVGCSVVNVAARCDLSEATVRTYVRRIYVKAGVNNRADLVRKLMDNTNSDAAPT